MVYRQGYARGYFNNKPKSAANTDTSGAGWSRSNFAVVRKLASSRMSVVYLVKKPDGGSAIFKDILEYVKGLKVEIKILQKNISPLFPQYITHGKDYVVMSVIPGVALADVINKYRLKCLGLPTWQVLDIMSQLLGQLAALHEARFVHRDIRPENIIIDDDGAAHLLDFGLACQLPHFEPTGPCGTLAYAPPEQINGGRVFPASDIYALGNTLHEMLTGILRCYSNMIFTGRLKEKTFTSNLHLSDINDKQREVLVEVRENLTALIKKMTAEAISNRYQSAADVLNDLKKIMTLWEYLAPFEKCWPQEINSDEIIERMKQAWLEIGGIQ
ncbi:serine/threonine protein kinase [Candidatus Saganbacteria bacterium]|nr:serine/threonine protein kinase [Candidatus Saganbacteria bacterium]